MYKRTKPAEKIQWKGKNNGKPRKIWFDISQEDLELEMKGGEHEGIEIKDQEFYE